MAPASTIPHRQLVVYPSSCRTASLREKVLLYPRYFFNRLNPQCLLFTLNSLLGPYNMLPCCWFFIYIPVLPPELHTPGREVPSLTELLRLELRTSFYKVSNPCLLLFLIHFPRLVIDHLFKR